MNINNIKNIINEILDGKDIRGVILGEKWDQSLVDKPPEREATRIIGVGYAPHDLRGLKPRMVILDFHKDGSFTVIQDNYEEVVAQDEVETSVYLHIDDEIPPVEDATDKQAEVIGKMLFQDYKIGVHDVSGPGATLQSWAFKNISDPEKMFGIPGKIYYRA